MGAVIASALGAGEGQMLAAAATVLGYGFIAGVISIPIAIGVVRTSSRRFVVRANIVLVVFLAVLLAFLFYRAEERRKQNAETGYVSPQVPTVLATAHPDVQRGNESLLGLGFYSPNFYENRVIHFYPEPEEGKVLQDHQSYDSLVFDHTEMDQHGIAYAPPYLLPAHLKMDYGILLFRVKRLANDYLEVVVNETTGRTAIVDRFSGTIRLWPEFILSVNTLELKNQDHDSFKVKPLAHAGNYKTEKRYRYLRPISVQGFWVEVSLLNESLHAEGRAWIKWRSEHELLVDYSLLS